MAFPPFWIFIFYELICSFSPLQTVPANPVPAPIYLPGTNFKRHFFHNGKREREKKRCRKCTHIPGLNPGGGLGSAMRPCIALSATFRRGKANIRPWKIKHEECDSIPTLEMLLGNVLVHSTILNKTSWTKGSFRTLAAEPQEFLRGQGNSTNKNVTREKSKEGRVLTQHDWGKVPHHATPVQHGMDLVW